MYFEVYGYGEEPREERETVCPTCGCACERAYYRLGEYIGCDGCVEEKDAWEAEECLAAAGRGR